MEQVAVEAARLWVEVVLVDFKFSFLWLKISVGTLNHSVCQIIYFSLFTSAGAKKG